MSRMSSTNTFIPSNQTEQLFRFFLAALKKASSGTISRDVTPINLNGLPPSFSQELRALFQLSPERTFLKSSELSTGLINIGKLFIGRNARIQQILNAICRTLIRTCERKSYPEIDFGPSCGLKTLTTDDSMSISDKTLFEEIKSRQHANEEEDEAMSDAFLQVLDSAEKIKQYRGKGREVSLELGAPLEAHTSQAEGEGPSLEGQTLPPTKPSLLRSPSMGMDSHVDVGPLSVFTPDAVTSEALENIFPDFFSQGGSKRDALSDRVRDRYDPPCRAEFSWICTETGKIYSGDVISRGELIDVFVHATQTYVSTLSYIDKKCVIIFTRNHIRMLAISA